MSLIPVYKEISKKKTKKAIFDLFFKKVSAARKIDEIRFSLFWENFDGSEYKFGLLKQRSQTFRKKSKTAQMKICKLRAPDLVSWNKSTGKLLHD